MNLLASSRCIASSLQVYSATRQLLTFWKVEVVLLDELLTEEEALPSLLGLSNYLRLHE